jgi:hypothetical protein
LSPQYNLTLTEQGSYIFTTDNGIEYTAFFTDGPIEDKDGNMHTAYSFGFERSGKFVSNKFGYKFDEKIKNTIIFIIKEFFRVNGNTALVYFCFPGDEYARHRSITFSKWHREELSEDIEHYKKSSVYQEEKLYGGILVLKENPLLGLLVEAVNVYIDEMADQK